MRQGLRCEEALSAEKTQKGGGFGGWSWRPRVGLRHVGLGQWEFPREQVLAVGTLACSGEISEARPGALLHSRGHSAMARDNFGHCNLGNANGIQWTEPRGAAKYPPVDRRFPRRELSSPRW